MTLYTLTTWRTLPLHIRNVSCLHEIIFLNDTTYLLTYLFTYNYVYVSLSIKI